MLNTENNLKKLFSIVNEDIICDYNFSLKVFGIAKENNQNPVYYQYFNAIPCYKKAIPQYLCVGFRNFRIKKRDNLQDCRSEVVFQYT